MTDFICLGVPKSGTTTLYAVLQQHRQIRFPKDGKNAYYYKKDGKTLREFNQRYWGNVKSKAGRKYGIMAENWYRSVDVDDFISDFPEDIKVIFMIRNPIERCYSEYKYTYAYRGLKGKDEKDYYALNHSQGFDKFIANNLRKNNPIIESGRYRKIREFYRKMKPDYIKVVILEDLMKNPKAVFQDLFDFLGIEKPDNLNYNIRANEGKYTPINKLAGMIYGSVRTNFMQNILCLKYGINKKSQLSEYILGYAYGQFEKLLVYDHDNSGISAATSDLLYEYYRKDIEKLQKILNRDLITLWFGA